MALAVWLKPVVLTGKEWGARLWLVFCKGATVQKQCGLNQSC